MYTKQSKAPCHLNCYLNFDTNNIVILEMYLLNYKITVIVSEKIRNFIIIKHLHMMPFQNQTRTWIPFPKRHHIEHCEWHTVHVFDMKWAIDTMAFRTIPLESVFSFPSNYFPFGIELSFEHSIHRHFQIHQFF